MAKKTIIGDDGREYTVKEKKPIYRRIWFWVFILFFAFLVANLELTDRDEPTAQSGDTQAATQSEKTELPAFKIGDTISTDKSELTILSTETLPEVTYSEFLKYTPDSEENVYFILHVRVKNIDKEAISVDSTGFSLYDGEIKYSPTTLLVDDGLSMERINPGTEIEKRVFYDVPADVANSNNLRVVISSGIFSTTGKRVSIELN